MSSPSTAVTDTTDLRAEAKRILEAVLFAAHHPVSLVQLKKCLTPLQPFANDEIHQLLNELQQSYRDHAFALEEIGNGYLLRTRPAYSHYVNLLHPNRRTDRLSQGAAETLAIIAYRQPITRPGIEAIRGVDSSGPVHALFERELIEAKGKLEAPGRPTLWGTTRKFLEQFGLKNLEGLVGQNK